MKIYKFDYLNDYKYLLLTNFHGSFDLNAAYEVSEMICDFVVITGDLLCGYQWESEIKLQELRDFLSIISEKHQIIISLRDQDLMKLSRRGFDMFKQLGKINNVYPIYNESIILRNNNSNVDNSVHKIGVSEYSSYTNDILASKSKQSSQKNISGIVNAYDLVENGYTNNKNISDFENGILYSFDNDYFVILSNNKIYYYDANSNSFTLSNKTKLKNRLKNNMKPAVVVDGKLQNYIKQPVLYSYMNNNELNDNIGELKDSTKIKKLG